MESEKNRIKELEARLTVLENENMILAERAEDTMLLSLFSELAEETTDFSDLLKKMLERVVVIKDITFSCAGILVNQKIETFAAYCSCSDKEIDISIGLDQKTIDDLQNGLVYLDKDEVSVLEWIPETYESQLDLDEIALFPFKFQLKQPAVFLFGNKKTDENLSLSHTIPLLLQVCNIAEERINTLYLLAELKKVNLELEERVLSRTEELESINRNLKAEIGKRKETELKLKLSEENYKEIFNNANDAIILWEAKANSSPVKCLDVNNVALRLTGYSREEFMALTSEQLRAPDLNYDPVRPTREIMSDRNTKFEVTLLTKDGRRLPTEANAHNFNLQGKMVTLAVHRDITERKEFENRLIKAKERAEESDRLKSAFLANMSHEIRTPMNAILGFTDVLQMDGLSKEDRANYSEIIHKKGEQLLTIINDLLYLSKIEANEVYLNPRTCDLSSFFAISMSNWEEMLKAAGKPDLEMVLDTENVSDTIVKLDDIRLSQILNNLVSNAIKFTHKGKITISCIQSKSLLLFGVSDTGIGVPSDKYDIIFDRFRQVDDSHTRAYGGTGLGLTICRQLVSLMGGEIGLESKVGEGSRFWFSIPVTPALKENIEVVESRLKTENVTGDILNNKNILVVEDDMSNFEFLSTLLEMHQTVILHAVDGEEAVKLVRENDTIDLVLMDLQLPKMNGFEAARLIKKEKPGLPVIAQTAISPEEVRIMKSDHVIDDFIFKPINISMFLNMIRRHL